MRLGENSAVDEPGSTNEGVRQRRALVVIAVVIGVGGIAFLKSQRRTTEHPPAAVAPKIDYAALVRQKVSEANLQDDLAMSRFDAALHSATVSFATKTEVASSAAAVQLSDRNAMASVVFYLAKDHLTSANQTDQYINNELQPILSPVVSDLGRKVNVTMGTLESDLRRSSVQLARDLASIGPGHTTPPQGVVARPDLNGEFNQALKSLGVNATIVAVSVPFDVAAIVDAGLARRIARSVASVAARMFVKQVGRAAATPALMSLPSPIPITQLLAIAGLAWTIYDLIKLQPDFHDAVYSSTKTNLDKTGVEMNKHAREFAAKKLKDFTAIQSAMGARSLQALSAPDKK